MIFRLKIHPPHTQLVYVRICRDSGHIFEGGLFSEDYGTAAITSNNRRQLLDKSPY